MICNSGVLSEVKITGILPYMEDHEFVMDYCGEAEEFE
jgi:hypothetical protein